MQPRTILPLAALFFAVAACTDSTAPSQPTTEAQLDSALALIEAGEAIDNVALSSLLDRYFSERPHLQAALRDGPPLEGIHFIPKSNPDCIGMALALYKIQDVMTHYWDKHLGRVITSTIRRMLDEDPISALQRFFFRLPHEAAEISAEYLSLKIQRSIIAGYMRAYQCI